MKKAFLRVILCAMICCVFIFHNTKVKAAENWVYMPAFKLECKNGKLAIGNYRVRWSNVIDTTVKRMMY